MIQDNSSIYDIDISKLNELTKEQLRDRILEVNNEQLSKVGKMSYYYLIGISGKLIHLINGGKLSQEIGSEEEQRILSKNFDYIINSIKSYHFDISEEEIREEIKKLEAIREELYNLSTAINGYEIELSYIKELIDYCTLKIIGAKEYKHVEINKNEIKILINKINEALANNSGEHFNFVSIVSNILSIMPLRMAKSKYFDVVNSTLTRNLVHYPTSLIEEQIEEYKMLFDSSLMGNYGIVFDYYFTRIQTFKNITLEGKSLEELERIEKDIIDVTLNLDKVGELINTLGVLTNRLMVIYLVKDKINFDEDTKEVFNTWKKYEDRRDDNHLDLLKELSDNNLTTVEKQLLNDVEYFEAINDEGIKRSGFFDDMLNIEMLFSRKVLTYYNDMEFTKHERLFPLKNDVVDSGYLEQLIDSLIQYINRSISTMNNLERRIRMRRLLSVLELPFGSIQEFLQYIQYSLDERLISKHEILFTIDAINHWLGELKEK